MPRGEVFHPGRHGNRPRDVTQAQRGTASIAPIADQADGNTQQRQQEGGQEDRHHGTMRKGRIKPLAISTERLERPEHCRKAQHKGQGDSRAMGVP